MANVVLRVGRYVLFDEIAAGGMATVHFGRVIGPAGFSRTVAIKRLHPQYAKDPDFVTMFLDEARIAARVHHPNVVAMLDVAASDGEMLLVMEYVSGATFSALARAMRDDGMAVPVSIACSVVASALSGLHAAHEAVDETGSPLALVHRDVSPQNILVGADGSVRVADFGIAKAAGRLQTTREGAVKGKSSYMSPEQIRGHDVDRRTDVHAAGVVLWEALTGKRLFVGDTPLATMNAVLEAPVARPSALRDVPPEVDALVMRALDRNRDKRFATAREMAIALEKATTLASPRELGEWVELVAGSTLRERTVRLREIETTPAMAAEAADASQMPRRGADEPLDATNNPHISEIFARPRARRFAPYAALAGGLALVVTGLGVYAFGRSRSITSARVSSTDTSDTSSSEAAAAVTLSAAPAVTGAPVVSSSASLQAPVGTRLPHVRVTPRGAATESVRCNPPFTIDESGVKHWKDGC